MARKLRIITSPLKGYLLRRFRGRVVSGQDLKFVSGRVVIPPPLHPAFLQGEALLRLKFFENLESKDIVDPTSQFAMWENLVENRKYVQQVVDHSGLLEHFKLSYTKDEPNAYGELCHAAYCIVLFDAHQRSEANLVRLMTAGFVDHMMPTHFKGEGKPKDAAVLKRRIATELAKQWKIRPQVTESFTTTDETVTFSLVAKVSGHAPVHLHKSEGKRLNPARLKACQTVLDKLESGWDVQLHNQPPSPALNP
jgi:hypothetical protein